MQQAWETSVMARTIQVRNVPEDLHRALRSRATAAGMSLSDYVLAELARLTARPPVAEVLTRAAARHGGVPIGEIVDAVRSGRDEPA